MSTFVGLFYSEDSYIIMIFSYKQLKNQNYSKQDEGKLTA